MYCDGREMGMQMIEKSKKVSIIIPAYNESAGIAATLKELITSVDLDETEIIVIDDGSLDNTAEIVSGFAEVRLIGHTRNQGYGTAIKTGVRNAKGEIVVWYDSDGQHRPEDLKKVVEEIEKKDLDYCIGVRGKESYVEKTRIFGKFVLRVLIQLFTHQKNGDFNSGLRGFKRSVLLKNLSFLPKGFGASTVTTLLMQEEGYIGGEVPITVRKRVGKSSVRQIRDGFRTIALVLSIILLFHPMRVFGNIGTIMILAGAFYGGIRALMWNGGLPVFAAVLILFGVQLFCFGLLSYQISCMRKMHIDNPELYTVVNHSGR